MTDALPPSRHPAAAALKGVSPPRWADRAVWSAVLLVVAGAGYALWANLQLVYDGSFQLAMTVRDGEPFVYLSRFHTAVLWWPAAWLSWRTDDAHLLSVVYGAPFLLAPAVGLALTWWVVRRHRPGLILWAGIGILGTSLPGQAFVINDSLFQQHLFWPVFFGLLVPSTVPQKVVMAGLAVFQLAHPVGAVLMGGAAGTAAVLAFATRDPWERRRLLHDAVFAGVFCGMAAWKLWWVGRPGTPYYDPYLAEEATWENAKVRWYAAVDGPPLTAVKRLYLTGAAALALTWVSRPRAGRSGGRTAAMVALVVVALVGVGLAAYALVPWSDDLRKWWGAVDYRRWLVPLTLPAYVLAFVEAFVAARRGARPAADDHAGADDDTIAVGDPIEAPATPAPRFVPGLALRACLLLLLAGLFAVVVGNQARVYKRLTDRLLADMLAGTQVATELPPGHYARETPLQHWSMGWNLLVLQGKRPTRLLVPTNFTDEPFFARQADAALRADPPKLPVHADLRGYGMVSPEPGPTGWFDFRELTAQAAAQRRAATPATRPATGPATPAD